MRPASPPSSTGLARAFPWLFAGIVGWKLWLAARFPFLADEAYFLLWGRHPALGYYDHPPMLGWWLAPLVRLGEKPWLVRLPTVAAVAAVVWMVYRWARPRYGETAAATTALLVLASPFYLVDVFVLTDTPLLLFTVAAGLLYRRAVEEERPRTFLAAGLCLGLAFLAKYLAVLLGIAFLLHAVVDRRRPVWKGLALTAAAAMPAVALHLWWNAQHGWATIEFNLVSRHVGEAARYTWRNVVICVATHLWFLGPVGLVLVIRRARRFVELVRDRALSPWLFAALVPLGLLSLSSAIGPFGAYWVMPFYPFLFLLLPRILNARELRRMLIGTGLFAALHVAVFTWAVARPLDAWRGVDFFDSLVMMEEPDAMARAVREAIGDRTLTAIAYSPASLLAWSTGGPVPVFGSGSHYARQDDFWTDWSALDGRDLAIFSKHRGDLDVATPYFESVRIAEIQVEGVTYYLALGDGFRYAKYLEEVLRPARRKYYRWRPTPSP